MNKLKTLIITLLFCQTFYGQFITVYTPTITPQNPGWPNYVKVITHVVTPNLGYKMYSNVSWDHALKKINISACYWEGDFTASKNIIDTINVGQLFPGNYQINIKLYSSLTLPDCIKSDSASFTYTISVSPSLLQENEKLNLISFYPNPVNDNLFVKVNEKTSFKIFNQLGAVVLQSNDLKLEKEIDVSNLPSGIYFIQLTNSKSEIIRKFLKE